MGKTIGLVCGVMRTEADSPLGDAYAFALRYLDAVGAAGGKPFGLLPVEGRLDEEMLSKCDALCILGGDRICSYHLQAVAHAYAHRKKFLGICLGMQAMHSFFRVLDEMERTGEREVLSVYERMKKEKVMFTLPVDGHFVMPKKRGEERAAAHPVLFKKGTLLQTVYGCDSVQGVTLHRYQVNAPSPRLCVSALHADGTVEGLEYGQIMLGVQYHPEMTGDKKPFVWLAEDKKEANP